MAWRCSGGSNGELVENLASAGIIQSAQVRAAMERVDRANYAPKDPYHDSPQRIGHEATISAPHMHAHAIELLKDHILARGDTRVLDVGCGSGYLASVIARAMEDNQQENGGGEEPPMPWVVGIDYIPELVELSEANMRKQDADLLESGKVHLFTGDGWAGVPDMAPFDAIHVGAAAAEIPERLVDQLKVGGRMIIPVGGSWEQNLLQIDKIAEGTERDRSYTVQRLMGVMYVPLVRVDS